MKSRKGKAFVEIYGNERVKGIIKELKTKKVEEI